jgi:hypothetical protein
METHEIWEAFLSNRCAGCDGRKRTRNAFCLNCYHQLPAKLKNALWQRFGSGFEQAYMACLSWFRIHPLQGEHRAKQQGLFDDAT